MRPSAVAELEAREEAGVSGIISKTALGRYRTYKCLPSGKIAPCEVTVFASMFLSTWRNRKEHLERKIRPRRCRSHRRFRARRRWRIVCLP